mgnify:CR=1 FL=1
MVEKAFKPPQECRAHMAGRCYKGDQCFESHTVPYHLITCCSVLKSGQNHYKARFRTCTALRVPLLCALTSLTAGEFGRSVVGLMFRSRVVPKVIRTDRGAEMRSVVMREILAVLDVRQVMGAALVPRHQGLCEASHIVVSGNLLILLHAVVEAHPGEWPALVPGLPVVARVAGGRAAAAAARLRDD